MTLHPALDPEEFRAAMRRTASAVGVLASDGPGGRVGITVSSLSSLSFDPASVICCVYRQSKALEILLQNGIFTANFLSDGQSDVANVFAGLVPEYRDRKFEIGEWKPILTGAPALMDSLCSFDCSVAKTFEFGTHAIIVGKVLSIQTGSDKPLIFSNRAYHKLESV
jgi:flavin reductase (DIM6/NTAB) family NADH-FMN oxidoreductase RutF